MSKLIKGREIARDYWSVVTKADNTGILTAMYGKNLIVPLKFWQMYRSEADAHSGDIGIWLNSDEDVAAIGPGYQDLPVIALNFPVFADGRSYSNARALRDELGYKGEIRAIGDVLRDQLYYMSRCGFNAFALRADQDTDTCLTAFDDFQNCYQGSVDQPLPLFRRR